MTSAIKGTGPLNSPICLVGEAPGEMEDLYGRPFIGPAGDELNRMLTEAGFCRKDCYVTNVFKTRPPHNKVDFFFTSRTNTHACLDFPPLGKGRYLHDDYRDTVRGLIPELVGVGAKLVIALGGTALWALLGYSKITAYAGTIHPPEGNRPFTVVPTFHPAAVLHQWSYRTTAIANLKKARTHYDTIVARGPATGPKPSRKFSPTIHIKPTLAQVRSFAARAIRAPLIAVDVETSSGQITTIAFAISSTEAMCIPFWEPPAPSYWPDATSEAEVWSWVRRILEAPSTKVFHNGAYDIQYIWRVHGIPIRGPIEDTMILHHAMEPELPKSLGALAAAYLDIPEWKTMRIKHEKEEE